MLTPPDGLPAPLKAIYAAVRQNRPFPSNLEALRGGWAEYLARARRQVPDVQIESEGEIVYLGELSPGCQACKAGTWDCIFTTMRCNLECGFCYSPQALPGDYAGSVFGATPEQIAKNHARTRITGISFSGGEPFLEPERLFEWVAWFKEYSPHRYTWIYTNGLLASEANLRRLEQSGVDEIRFDTAATGYTHPTVMQNLARAADFIPNVTVEIPAIPEQAEKLLSALEAWSARGVKFLNLHELIYEPGSLSASMTGKRQAVVLEDGHRTEINPESRLLTLAVMEKVQASHLPLSVNDCSLQSKLLQVRGRRRNLAPLTKEPYEKLVRDEIFESYCMVRDADDYRFFHPDSLAEIRACHPEYKLVRIAREAPLSLKGNSRWIACEEC